MKKVIFSPNAPAPIGNYSQAILAGGTLYVSGQIPLHPQSMQIINTSIEAQTTQVLDNIGAILKAANFSFENVVKTTILLSDISAFEQVNAIYSKYFPMEGAPARETYQVAALPKGVGVEISCIAVQ